GTNAHVVLEEAPRAAAAPAAEASAFVLPLSAKSPEALTALADAYEDLLRGSSAEGAASLEDIAYTASVRRSHHPHRLCVVGRSHDELATSLAAFVRGEAHAGVSQGKVSLRPRPRLVFVFSGQGSQWAGMGRA